jgi:hypothetical protein
LRLLPAKEAENSFASALESGLRAQGFTVTADASPDAVIVAYTLDALYEYESSFSVDIMILMPYIAQQKHADKYQDTVPHYSQQHSKIQVDAP